jgi:hypothetical protein
MCPALWIHTAGSRPLYTVISDSRGCIECLRYLIWLDDASSLHDSCPDPSVAICLEFECYRELVLPTRILLHARVDTGECTELILEMVCYLMGDHISLSHIAPASTEPLG